MLPLFAKQLTVSYKHVYSQYEFLTPCPKYISLKNPQCEMDMKNAISECFEL